MKRSLQDIVFLSEKRKRLLLLLEDSPKTIEYIVDELKTSRHGMLPQINILNDQRLIEKKNAEIHLSIIGNLLISEIKNIVDTVDFLENDYDYWTNRDYSGIPEHLFKRITELHPCQIYEPELNEMFEFTPDILEGMMRSEYVFACASFIHPSYPSVFHELARKGTNSAALLTEDAIKILETDFKEGHIKYIHSDDSSVYAIKELKLPGLIVTDSFVLLWLFNKKGDFEPRYIISKSKTAVNWGNEFFEHYKKDSEMITDIKYSI